VKYSQINIKTLEDLGMEKLENATVVDKLGDALMDVINSAERKGDSVSFDILSEIKKAIGSN
jgi:hypothetical protein